jgi:hypothetical protein
MMEFEQLGEYEMAFTPGDLAIVIRRTDGQAVDSWIYRGIQTFVAGWQFEQEKKKRSYALFEAAQPTNKSDLPT